MDLRNPSFRELGPPAPEASSPAPQTIFLHILSPSLEVPNKLTFPAIPVNTTIGELKDKIQDALATKPSPGRQRLIYRGKALVKTTDTMKDVFGQEAIDDPVAHSLHLVLPPSNVTLPSATTSTTASSVTGISVPSRSFHIPSGAASQEQHLPPAQTAVGSGQQAPLSGSSGGFQGHHLANHNGHNSSTHAHGHIPPHFQAAMNTHFAALSQQLGQQLAMGTVNPSTMPAQPLQSNHLHHLSTNGQPSFQQVITQQQQARAAAGRQGVAEVPSIDSPQDQAQPLPGLPRSVNVLAAESQTPNGNNWRITVNESTTTIPTAHTGNINTNGVTTTAIGPVNPQGPFGVTAHALTFPRAGHQRAATHSTPTNMHTQAPGVETAGRSQAQHNETVHEGVIDLERMLAGGTVPSLHQITAVRSQISEMVRHRNVFSEGLEGILNTRLSNISSRASQMERNSARDGTPSENMIQVALSVANNMSPMVYLLSSPSGPHALLVSPSGLYGTNARINPILYAPASSTTSFQQRHRNQPQVDNPMENVRGQPPALNRLPNDTHPMPQDQAQPHDLARILLPLGGHLWLFVRLFGFVYFFTPGGGWRRAAVLFCSALLVIVLQSGFLRPFYQAAWGPLRRHLEGLVPLADNNRRDIGNFQGAVGPDGRNQAQAVAGGDRDVRQAAERLLRERERRDLGVVRRYLRNFERAIAIFFASLVPGIGERHIAARDTAEAVRVVEELEREGGGVGSEEVPEVQDVEEPNQREPSTNTPPVDRNDEGGHVTHDQPPVVEI